MKNDSQEIYVSNSSLIELIQNLLIVQSNSKVQIVRKEAEVLLSIKIDPRKPVKFYMNKSEISNRWFNEIIKQLVASKLVVQETCKDDTRRKLLS